MMTGEELYDLLQARAPGFFWATWGLMNPEIRDAFNAVADELNEREADMMADGA